jgi:hypothetical protein
MEPLLEHQQTQAGNPEDCHRHSAGFLPARWWHHLPHSQRAP